MASFVRRDRHGTFSRKRKEEGPPLDRYSSRWYAVVSYRDKDGKRKQRWLGGYPTKAEAEDAARQEETAWADGSAVAPSKLTLSEMLDRWLEDLEQRSRLDGAPRPATISHYRTEVGYVLPHLGGKRLQDVTPADLDRLYTHLREHGRKRGGGLSAKSVRHVHGMLRTAFSWAASPKRRLIGINPAAVDDVAPPGKSPAMKTWSPEQLRTFLDHVADDRYVAMWRLFAVTGMRRGEVLGLRWADVDLDNNTVRVAQTLIEVNNTPTISEPKTPESRRTIDVDDATVQALRDWRRIVREERMVVPELAGDPPDDSLVFADAGIEALRPTTVTRWFQRHAEDAGLPRIRLHDVRHSVASALLNNQVPVTLVSARLGHTNAATTLSIYGHPEREGARQTADKMASLIDG